MVTGPGVLHDMEVVEKAKRLSAARHGSNTMVVVACNRQIVAMDA